MKKRRRTRGESIAETLVAVLLMALVFLMLTGAVLTAAHINERVKNEEVAFSGAASSATKTATIQMGGTTRTQSVTIRQTDNGYQYYEATEETAAP